MEDLEQRSKHRRERSLDDHGTTDTTSTIPRLEFQYGNTISCTPCALSFIDPSELTLHLKSEEHANMILVTGFGEEASENRYGPFPPLFCCMLCNVWHFDSNTCEIHLKSETHKSMAEFMRNMSDKRRKNIRACRCVYKMLSDSYPPLHYCELCDVWSANCRSFNEHIRCGKHRRTVLFINVMCNSSVEKIPGTCSGGRVSEIIGNSFSQSPYCHVCNIQFSNPGSYKTHTLKGIPKTFTPLMINVLDGIEKNDALEYLINIVFENFKNSLSLLKYCESCNIWLKDSKLYKSHLNSKGHGNDIRSNRVKKCSISALSDVQTSEFKKDLFSSTYNCESCNIRFNESTYYYQHLELAIHKRIEEFKDRKEENIISVHSEAPLFESVSNPLPVLHYCEVCNIWCSASEKRYINHLNGKIHKRNLNYIRKLGRNKN